MNYIKIYINCLKTTCKPDLQKPQVIIEQREICLTIITSIKGNEAVGGMLGCTLVILTLVRIDLNVSNLLYRCTANPEFPMYINISIQGKVKSTCLLLLTARLKRAIAPIS